MQKHRFLLTLQYQCLYIEIENSGVRWHLHPHTFDIYTCTCIFVYKIYISIFVYL